MSVFDACTQLVNKYTWYLDHPGSDLEETARQFSHLFTENAELVLGNLNYEDETFIGREAIARRYLQGRSTMRFVHFMTNLVVHPQSDDAAVGASYVRYYVHPIGVDMKSHGAISGLAEYRDEYERGEEGWRFRKRRSYLRFDDKARAISDPLPFS